MFCPENQMVYSVSFSNPNLIYHIISYKSIGGIYLQRNNYEYTTNMKAH